MASSRVSIVRNCSAPYFSAPSSIRSADLATNSASAWASSCWNSEASIILLPNLGVEGCHVLAFIVEVAHQVDQGIHSLVDHLTGYIIWCVRASLDLLLQIGKFAYLPA